MRNPNDLSQETRSAGDDSRFPKLVREFEQLWQAGFRPEIVDYLERVDAQHRGELLEELGAVEVRLRRGLEETVAQDEFNSHSVKQDVSVRQELQTPPATKSREQPPTLAELPEISSSAAREFGEYQILSEIARGGMGVVYKARQKRLNRVVALKMILAGEFAGDEAVQRFHAEATAAANLEHPGIVPIFDVGEHNGQHFFSMAFVDGSSLAEYVADSPLPPHQAAELVALVAEAMHYAHTQGVIHRDLKPDNILLAPRTKDAKPEPGSNRKPIGSSRSPLNRIVGNFEYDPKITDFGLAKQIQSDTNLTVTGQILGTPSYMSPEQARGVTDVGPETDVYALGAILYSVLVGKPPFRAAHAVETIQQVVADDPIAPSRLNPAIDRDLETICLKCLEKEPAKRYATASDLVDELMRYLHGETILARPVSSVRRIARWSRRHPYTALSAVLSLLLVLSVTAGVPLFMLQQRRIKDADHRRILSEQLATAKLQRAKDKGAQAEQVAAMQKYYADTRKARELRLLPTPGWTWEAVKLIQGAARSGSDVRDTTALRSMLANTLLTLDLKLLATYGQNIEAGSIAISPDGRFFAVAEIRGTPNCSVYIYQIHRSSGTEGTLTVTLYKRFSISTLGNKLLSIFGDAGIGTTKHEGFRALCFSSDSDRVAAGTRTGKVYVWSLSADASGPELLEIDVGNEINEIGFSKDGTQIFVIDRVDSRLELWDAMSGKLIRTSSEQLRGFTSTRQHGELLALAHDGIARWNTADSDFGPPRLISDDWYSDFDSSDDGSVLAAQQEGNIFIVNATTGFRAAQCDNADQLPCEVTDLGMSRQGGLVAGGLDTGIVRIWDGLSGRAVVDLPTSGDKPILTLWPAGDELAVHDGHQTQLYQLRAPTLLGSNPRPTSQLGAADTRTASSLLLSPSPVQAFDIGRDGKFLAIMETEGKGTDRQHVFRSVIRTVNSHSGDEEGRWVCASLVRDTEYLNSLDCGDVCFLDDANSLAVACEIPGNLMRLSLDGFQFYSGAEIDVIEVEASEFGHDFVSFEQPALSTTSESQPCVVLHFPSALKIGEDEIEITLEAGHNVWNFTLDDSVVDARGWYLIHLGVLAPRNLTKTPISIVVRLKSTSMRLVSRDQRRVVDDLDLGNLVLADRMLLCPTRRQHPRENSLGPLSSTASGELVSIVYSNQMRRWSSDALAPPEFGWRDRLNDSPAIRDLASSKRHTVVGMRTGLVYLVDGNEVRRLKGPIMKHSATGEAISRVAISPHGEWAAAGTLSGQIFLFNLNNPDTTSSLTHQAHQRKISAIACSTDGDLFATGSVQGIVRLWKRHSDRLEMLLELDQHESISDLQFTPDVQRIIIQCEKQRGLRIVNLAHLNAIFADSEIAW